MRPWHCSQHQCRGSNRHDGLMPYLPELLGPYFRIDHDYCLFMRRGDARGGLHGGSHLRHSWSDHWYRYQDGLMRNGLTVITFFLTDAAAGDGGFACVPGSHKSNYLDLLPPEVRNYERPAPYVLHSARIVDNPMPPARKGPSTRFSFHDDCQANHGRPPSRFFSQSWPGENSSIQR